jgi:hypothetical protein
MGLNNDMLADVSPIVVDIETCGLSDADKYLEPIPDAVMDESPIEAAKNLVDPVKIAADLEKKRAARAEQNAAAIAKVEQLRATRDAKLALDWNVGRIAAIGAWTLDTGVIARVCQTEEAEAKHLEGFWKAARYRSIVGFNLKGFDLRFMIQRSRYLGVQHPQLDLGKYSRKGIIDIYLDLTFNDGTYDQGAMRRTLHAFCRRFGIQVDDSIKGADVPLLVAAGDWDSVLAHVTSDVQLTLALARKLGVVQPEAVAVVV